MTQITGGSVAYERSVKVADYENKKAKVELSFNIEEGASAEAQEKAIDYVLGLATAKCEGILGIRGAAPAGVRTKADLTAEAEATAGKPKPKVMKLPPPAPAKVEAPADVPAKAPPSAAEVTDEAPAEVASDGLDSTPAKEVTDADLIHEVQKANNEAIKNPLGIRQLAARIGGLKSLQSVTQVPQEKRGEFLKALAEMAEAVKAAKKAA